MYHEILNTQEFTPDVSSLAFLSGASQFTLHENEIQSTKEYVRNYQRIMQNKPNFQNTQMNLNLYNTTDYERKRNWTLGENKPNSNPNKANPKRAKMNINSIITKDYRKKDDFEVRINKPNFRKAQNERKLICYRGLQKKNDFAVQKNKPNSKPMSESYPDAAASFFCSSKVQG